MFELLKFVTGVLVGPLGVALGWWLSERSRSKRAREEEAREGRTHEAERAIRLLETTRTLNSEARSLGHGYYLRASGRPIDPDQKRAIIDAFNEARSDFELALLKVQALGPNWVVGSAESIEDLGREATVILLELEAGARGQRLQDIQDVISRQEEEASAMVRLVRSKLATT